MLIYKVSELQTMLGALARHGVPVLHVLPIFVSRADTHLDNDGSLGLS